MQAQLANVNDLEYAYQVKLQKSWNEAVKFHSHKLCLIKFKWREQSWKSREQSYISHEQNWSHVSYESKVELAWG